jgi:hypothetical protein
MAPPVPEAEPRRTSEAARARVFGWGRVGRRRQDVAPPSRVAPPPTPLHLPPTSRTRKWRRRRGSGGGRAAGAGWAEPRSVSGVGGGGRGWAAWATWPGRGGGGHGLGRVAGEVPEAGSGVLEGTHRGRGVGVPLALRSRVALAATCLNRGGLLRGVRARPPSPLHLLRPPLPCLHLQLPGDGTGRCLGPCAFLQKGAGVWFYLLIELAGLGLGFQKSRLLPLVLAGRERERCRTTSPLPISSVFPAQAWGRSTILPSCRDALRIKGFIYPKINLSFV